jgi:hypothetical protein
MVTYYRIVDTDRTSQILANAIPSYEQAFEILQFLQKDYPDSCFEIESYTHNHVKPGFGRDPDLH